MSYRARIKIVGLDLSLTSTGIATTTPESGVPSARVEKTSNKISYPERYNKLLESILREVPEDKKVIFFIEGYSFGSFAKSSSMSYLIELGGIIKFELWKRGLPYIIVPPSLLKKFITGKGNAKKEDIKLHIYKKYGKEFSVSDAADAYGLIEFGSAYLTGNSISGKELTKTEQECIHKQRETELDT